MYDTMKQNFLDEYAPDWEVSPVGVLVCPHGHLVEDDGQCQEGCVSPMREMGII